MANYLLVEDDQFKQSQLVQFLSKRFPNEKLNVVKSISGAIEAIDSATFEWIFLDMSLPMYEVGRERPRSFGGKTILQYLDNLERNDKVIVITQFQTHGQDFDQIDIETLRSRLLSEFEGMFKGLVFFSDKSDAWKVDLESLLTDF